MPSLPSKKNGSSELRDNQWTMISLLSPPTTSVTNLEITKLSQVSVLSQIWGFHYVVQKADDLKP